MVADGGVGRDGHIKTGRSSFLAWQGIVAGTTVSPVGLIGSWNPSLLGEKPRQPVRLSAPCRSRAMLGSVDLIRSLYYCAMQFHRCRHQV